MSLTTEPFKITPAAYARHQMRMWTRHNWWIVNVPQDVAVIKSMAVDWRFLFVAVILVFLVLPHIMVTVYYYHALSPKSAMSILRHRIVFEAEVLRIVYEDEDAEDSAVSPRPDDIIRRSDISAVTVQKSDILLHLAGGRYDIIVVPSGLWPEEIPASIPFTS